MSRATSFSSRYLSMRQHDNSVQAISSMLPSHISNEENSENNNNNNQYEINPEFIMNELNNRVTIPLSPQAGFSLPDQAPPHQYCWPCHGYKDTKPHPETQNQSFFTNQEYEEEPKFTFVRMGDSSIQNIIKYGRTPELPHRTRARPSTQMTENYPHYRERPSRTNIRQKNIKIPHKHNREENEYFSWKYFGNTNNVCGCYTAKIPLGMKEHTSTKTISKLPNGSNKIQKVTKKNQPQKHQKQNKFHHLYDQSIKKQGSDFELRDVVESNVENHEFDQYLDGETDSYIEYKGKMIPLKYSNLSRFYSGMTNI